MHSIQETIKEVTPRGASVLLVKQLLPSPFLMCVYQETHPSPVERERCTICLVSFFCSISLCVMFWL